MWVYDIVRDANMKIVALQYHVVVRDSPCLRHDEKTLNAEGLDVDCSQAFETLAEARQHAWANHEDFAKDLD